MTHRLYQLLAECDDWELQLLRIIEDSSPAPGGPRRRSSARTLLVRVRYFARLRDAFEPLSLSTASSDLTELDALVSSLDSQKEVDELLTAVGMPLDDRLRPRSLRKTMEANVKGDSASAPAGPCATHHPRIDWVARTLEEFNVLLGLTITRNESKLIEYLGAHPKMIVAQALAKKRGRVLEILYSLRTHNVERAYEIVAIFEGVNWDTIRKT